MRTIGTWLGLTCMPRKRTSGEHGLWIFRNGKTYGACSIAIYNQPYKPSDYPYLHFDYRGRMRSVMIEVVHGQQKTPLMTVPLIADGSWHGVSLPIGPSLAQKLNGQTELTADDVLLTLNYPHDLEIDNIIVSSREKPR